jgi:hypothetical protein
MSYVAVSDKFKSDVKNKLRQMRYREVNSVPSLDYKLSSTRPDVITWAWGEHLHLKDQMPAKWCGKADNVQIRFETQERGVFRIRAELTPPLVTPPGGTPQGVVSISPDDPDIKPYVERESALYDIVQRWDKVDKQILEFLGKCKSVNEALKLWPQIEMYIPPEFITKVNEKKERSAAGPSRAAEALKALDTDHLTTAAVISRMSGQEE